MLEYIINLSKQFCNYLLNKKQIFKIVMYFLSDKKKEKIYIKLFRNDLLLFDYDTSHLTDEEMKIGFIKMGELISTCAFTLDEITTAMKTISNYDNKTIL